MSVARNISGSELTDMQTLHTEIHKQLLPLVDSAYLTKIQELVPTGWTVLGVRVPQVRALAKELQKSHQQVTIDDLVALLNVTFSNRVREETLCSIFWLAGRKRHLTPALWPHIDDWIDQIGDWEICDQLATGVAAPVVAKELMLVETLIQWTASPNVWRRRFTVATASALNQKGRSHVAETIQICTPLMTDDAAMVRKAVGWALREASKHDPEQVYHFLLEWQDQAPRTLLRESAAKLSESQKATVLAL